MRNDRPGQAAGRAGLLALVGVATMLAMPVGGAQRGGGDAVGRAAPRTPSASQPLSTEDVAAYAVASARGLSYLPGEVLVKFRAGTSPDRQARALSSLRGRPLVSSIRWVGDVARVRDASEPDSERAAARLRSQPEVEYAQPNYLRRLPRRVAAPRTAPIRVGAAPTRIPNDPSYSEVQWNLRLIDAPAAWAINPGGSRDLIVAVLDTGFTTVEQVVTRRLWTGQEFSDVPLRYASSPDLDMSRVVFARDFAFEDGDNPVDMVGHGTHVASTIAEQTNNAFGLAGLAYNVRLMPLKVCLGFWELMIASGQAGIPGFLPEDVGGCTDAEIADAVRYAADSGARVINMSFGGPEPGPVVRDALAYAVSRGAFVATSMGNAYEQGNAVDYPAAYAPDMPGMMSVGAVGKSRARAFYSSTGDHIEIAAPGGDSRNDDGAEDAGFVWQITLFPDDVDPLVTSTPRFDRYFEVGYIGTSMATPHVSALAALLMSQGITNPRAVEAAIERTAVDLGPAGHDEEFGHGLIQARDPLFGLGIR